MMVLSFVYSPRHHFWLFHPQDVAVFAGQWYHSVRVHPRGVHPDVRMPLPGGHPGHHSQKVCQFALLYLLLQQPFYLPTLGGHSYGVLWDGYLHWPAYMFVQSQTIGSEK